MGYRGEDLDLYTPQTWGTGEAPVERARRGAAGRPGPLWVDEVVLACCNHAFDVASAHRAEEVRIEHLLHALTRIEAAAEVLHGRGIRVAALRRESATIIAGEIPVSAAPPGTPPRRSNEMAEVLRMAVGEAARRNAPASVVDILDVLLDARHDMPGIGLILHHLGRPAREPAEVTVRAHSYPQEPRYVEREPVPVREAPPPPRDWPRRRNAEARPAHDSLASVRIDGLERAIEAIGAELGDDRAMLQEALQDLRGDLAGHREDQSRLGGSLNERLSLLEQIVSSPPAPRDSDKVMDRLRGIDDRLNAVDTALDHRLNELTRHWSGLGDRLLSVEHAVREPRPLPVLDMGPLEARLATVEATIRETRASEQQAWLGLVDRLKGVETALGSPGNIVDLAPIGNRLDIIEEALLGRDSEPTHELAERSRALEAAIAAHRAQTLETSSSIAAEIKALSGALSTHASQAERIQSSQGDRLQVLAGLVDRHRAEVAGTVVEPLQARIQGVGQQLAAMAQRVDIMERGLAERLDVLQRATVSRITGWEQQFVGRLAALETAAQKTAEGQAGINQALARIAETLLHVQAGQQQIASDVEKWHAEAAGDISVVANRLESIERESVKPLKLIEAMSAGMDRVQRIAVERDRRRSRFWYWLFGTDDWQRASWPEAVASVERKRSAEPKKR